MSNISFCKIIDEIETSLNVFLGEHTIHATDRSKHIVWAFDDKINKKSISIVFTDVNNLEEDIKMEYVLSNGYVLVVPNYWVNVPRPLALEYLLSLIVDYYGQTLNVQYDKEDIENSFCQCPWVHNWTPCVTDRRAKPITC